MRQCDPNPAMRSQYVQRTHVQHFEKVSARRSVSSRSNVFLSGNRNRVVGSIPFRSEQMTSTPNTPVTLVNILAVRPEKQQMLVDLLQENTETVIRTLKGWIATDLISSADGEQVVIHSRWETQADVNAMRADPRMVAYFPRIAELASLKSIVGKVVMSHHH
jgi:quinol monooxygenase YgiN